MERCSPHAWRTPAVGDEALVCDVCESRQDLVRDITAEAKAEIVREYRRHNGPIVGGHFEEALEAALAAARERASGVSPGSPGEGSA
ncbi:MAG: hypothetical protein OXC15_02050 [Rhodospirillaceae bacterium]|nr:hypothetical protein [Rhodospirillaceae bacterium]